MVGRSIRWLRTNVVGLVVWGLLITGAWFTVQVEDMRARLRHTGGADFKDGERVVMADAIDGDEVSVLDSKKERAVVRLLGIKTFSPSRTSPYEGRYGKQAFEFLKALKGQPMILTLNTPPRDSKGRVLAYAEMADGVGYDVGKRMIERGIAVAYTRYGHTREADYLKAEEKAILEQRGLWGDATVAQRVKDLKRQWFLERAKEE